MATSTPVGPPAAADVMAWLPEDRLTLYDANPFRVLGLPTTASGAEAQRAANRLLVMQSLGEGDVDEYRVREAVQCLSDPRRRLVAEWFWLHLDGSDAAQSVDAATYQQVLAGDRNGAAQVWRAIATQGTEAAQAIALHNVAILYHWHVLATETGLYRHFPTDQQFDHNYLQVWQATLKAWVNVWTNPRSWDYLRQRVVELGDPRLRLDTVEALRSALPATLLQINRDLAVQYLHSGHTYVAKQHLDLILHAGFDHSLALSLCREALNPLKEQLQRVCAATSQQLQASAERAQQIYQDFLAQIGPEVQKLTVLDPQQQLSTGPVRDGIAETIRAAAVAVHNHAHRYKQAVDMLQEALQFATSPSVCSRLQAELKVCQESVDTWGEHYSPDLCWFCKRRQAAEAHALTHPMHKVTGRFGTTISYNTFTVKIPRCGTCTWWHTFAYLCGLVAGVGVAGAVLGAGAGKTGTDRFWGAMFLGAISYGLGLLPGKLIGWLCGTRSQASKRAYPLYTQAKKAGFVDGAKPATN